MRINFENNKLITVGTDGVLAIFAGVDKKPTRKTDGKEPVGLPKSSSAMKFLLKRISAINCRVISSVSAMTSRWKK
jgi:hypothetical protein